MFRKRDIFLCITLVLLIVLTVCGSIWDLDIAKAVYVGQLPSDNMFGIIFSFIGIIPTFVGWSFLGASILCLSKKYIQDTKKRGFTVAFAIFLILLSFFYFCNTLYISNSNAFEVHIAVAYGVGIAVIAAAAYIGYFLSKKSNSGERALKHALLIAAVSLVALLIISVTKEIMCRPRFRFVLAMDDFTYFRNWWENGRELKAAFASDVVTDEFASLPSGHSAYSMFAVFIFPHIANYVQRLRKFKPLLFALGLLWWAATAFSRMTIGAHYLTDVAIAGLLAILSYGIVSAAYSLYKKRRSS
jgi:membrane-associated phospholipid phosphatase